MREELGLAVVDRARRVEELLHEREPLLDRLALTHEDERGVEHGDHRRGVGDRTEEGTGLVAALEHRHHVAQLRGDRGQRERNPSAVVGGGGRSRSTVGPRPASWRRPAPHGSGSVEVLLVEVPRGDHGTGLVARLADGERQREGAGAGRGRTR